MTQHLIGTRAPPLLVGQLVGGRIESVSLQSFLSEGRAIVIGIPGAFTPVCSCEHVPDFVAQADRLRAAGFSKIVCLAPNDPWALDAWIDRVDPAGKVTFLSDGNLAVARALSATIVDYGHFLGERSARFLMVTHNGVIERLTIEPQLTSLTCTRVSDVVDIE